MYRLEVQHYVYVDPPPDERPLWKRVLGISTPFSGSHVEVASLERLSGRYFSLDEAYEAAENSAAGLTGKIPDDSGVLIIDEATNEEIEGFYPNRGGTFGLRGPI